MVVESLLNIRKARQNPKLLIPIGFVYTLIAAVLGLWIFPSRASFATVFLATSSAIPLMFMLLREEELRDEAQAKQRKRILIREHKDVFLIYLNMFIGMVFGFSLLFTILPDSIVLSLFEDQMITISIIRGGATLENSMFMIILANNLKVLFFCLLFSFIFGSGAVFILTWNASVLGTAIGEIIRFSLQKGIGLSSVTLVPLTFAKYFIHGLPEIGAYLLAGIAGGIISTAVIRNKISRKYITKIVLDTADLVVLAILLLFLAALIEVSISPLIVI